MLGHLLRKKTLKQAINHEVKEVNFPLKNCVKNLKSGVSSFSPLSELNEKKNAFTKYLEIRRLSVGISRNCFKYKSISRKIIIHR